MDSEFGDGVLIGLFLVIVLLVFMPPWFGMDTDTIDWADKVCEDNGGLEHLRPQDSFYRVEATCGNGAEFTKGRGE